MTRLASSICRRSRVADSRSFCALVVRTTEQDAVEVGLQSVVSEPERVGDTERERARARTRRKSETEVEGGACEDAVTASWGDAEVSTYAISLYTIYKHYANNRILYAYMLYTNTMQQDLYTI